MTLEIYKRKRNFRCTPEPPDKVAGRSSKRRRLRFVVQMHDASRLHYDLRLEIGGVFKSWAVPKGPSPNPSDQRLAVAVEDHPLAYGDFEGIIPAGNYGAGTVLIWDRGHYEARRRTAGSADDRAMQAGLADGHLTFVMHGQRLRGEFALVRIKAKERMWLLVKKRDEFASYKRTSPPLTSVVSGRDLEEIRRTAEHRGEVWLPGKGRWEEAEAPSRKPIQPTLPKGDLAQLRGFAQAANERLPHRLKMMLPTVDAVDFSHKDWLFEPEFQGYRAILEVQRGSVRLYTRQFLSFNKRYPEVCDAAARQLADVVLDGSVVELSTPYKSRRYLRTGTVKRRPVFVSRSRRPALLPMSGV